MGGSVYWAGKPHPSAYEAAHSAAERVRGLRVEKSRVLAIGDAVRTDLAGAAGAGVAAVFIASGIHREETMDEGRLSEAKLGRLFGAGSPPAIAAMTELRW